jgi:hypothetical protein
MLSIIVPPITAGPVKSLAAANSVGANVNSIWLLIIRARDVVLDFDAAAKPLQ